MSGIESYIGYSCPILLHDEMKAILHKRHKVSYSDPLRARASSCLVRFLFIVWTRATFYDVYTKRQ